MRIVHVHSVCDGGAAEAALRLHRGLLRRGIDSTFFNLHVDRPEERIERYRPGPGLFRRLERKGRWARNAREMRGVKPERFGFECFSLDRTDLVPDLFRALPSCDVVHFHAATEVVDFGRTPGALARAGRPVVWTLHDMNPFTGGCHYDQDCGRYRDGCGRCPVLGSDDPRDLSARIWRRKRRGLAAFDPARVRLVSPSRWLGKLAAESPLLGRFPVEVVPNGVDPEQFFPLEKGEARMLLGLPMGRPIVLLAASNLATRRKGFDHLLAAVERVRETVPDLLLACVGGSPASSDGKTVFLGPFSDPTAMRAAYGAADLVALPSLQDNLPNTALEAMACGVPVVGFAAGGIPDMVRDGESGVTVPVGDVAALAEAIRELLQDGARRESLGRGGRRIVEAEYRLDIQAAAYHNIYRGLLS